MRKLFVIGAVGLLAAPVAAQRAWQPEIGVQAGFSSVKPAGVGADATTLIDLPGGTFVNALLSYAPMYGIVPAGRRLAVEPQLGLAQINGTLTAARVGLRLDYAFGSGLYGAAGGVLNYLSPGSLRTTQLGAQIAVGYRTHLMGALNGRVEADWVSTHSGDALPAFNAYSVLIGVSSPVSGAPRAARPARSATSRWSPVLGLTSGYASAHPVGGGASFSGIFFPGLTNSIGPSAATPLPAPPTLFAILPLGDRWAIEPGIGFHHVSESGVSASIIELGARVDYAVTAGWYAAGGGQLANVNPAAGSSGSITGVSVGWGYRFHLSGSMGGRTEINYLMNGKSDKLGFPPINTLSLQFGLTMPLR